MIYNGNIFENSFIYTRKDTNYPKQYPHLSMHDTMNIMAKREAFGEYAIVMGFSHDIL